MEMKKENKFNEILKELRVEKGLSQKDLAKEIGYTQAAVARWEAKKQIPNLDVLTACVNYFGVTADYMLGFED